MGTPFQPLPCDSGGGGAADAVDVEQSLLCDVLPDGSVAGTALAVYEYDATGAPVGAPTFINPATGAPYVAQGILQPCPGEVGCAPPVQFCFTSTASGPVEHPGRMYDITLPINPGFAVASLQIDATNYPANLLWAVTDADGSTFAGALQAFLAARFPGETVTVNNPNAGTPVCGLAIPMTIHIECTRVDAPAPALVELIFNGGRDLVVNPAYLTTPPTNLNGPQFVYMQRQDAGGTLNCTGVANRGWESNDGPPGGADFELWGQGPGGLQTQEAATPTPRGTPIQEITADFPAGGARPTIWQTFTVPAAGVLKAVLVHGARDNGEQHKITLSTGDDDANQTGDIINNVTNPPAVTNSGGGIPGPWTSFSQDVALGVGTYTFAISTTNPVGANRGGLFTDMRVYVDAPDQHATAVNDDDTCTITTQETTTTTTCEYWQPRCANGEITAWVNVADGQELTNAAFWGQAPAPSCCLPTASSGGGSVTAGNLVHNYEVCGIVGGIATTLQRVVITDQSGGVIGETFVGPDGGPVSPTSFVVGSCGTGTPVVGEFIVCDDNGPFVRKLIQSDQGIVTAVVNVTLAGVPYVPVGAIGTCPGCVPTVLDQVCVVSTDFPGVVLPAAAVQACDGTMTYLNASTGQPWPNVTSVVVCPPENTPWEQILCDAGNNGTPFRRIYNLTPLGSAITYDEDFDSNTYVPVGPVGVCDECSNTTTLLVCDLPTGDPDGVPTVTNSNQQFIADTANADFIPRPGGGGALWTGGVINFGPDVSPGPGPITQIHRFVAATLQAAPPSCTDGTVHLSLSVEVLNQGPGTGCSGAGRFRLYRVSDGAVLSSGTPLFNTPVGASVVLSIEADIAAAELAAGNVAVWLDVETWQTGTCPPPDSKTWQASQFTASYSYGTAGCETQFLRTVVTDCETGATLATVDTTVDGAPYVVLGEAGQCSAAGETVRPADCASCQTLTLCDFGADVPVLITGISTGGTLSNGITWSGARGSAANFNPQHNNIDGSWWGMPSFPNSTVAPDTWSFDRPVDVEFSVVIAHSFGTGSGAINSVQVPIGSELISAASDYSYDATTGIVTVDSSNNGDCTKVTNPVVAKSARFRLRNVSQFTLDFLGQRIAICGQFSNWRFGSIAVTPSSATFLRTICRACDGAVTSVTDTQADGATPYTPIGPVGDCGIPADVEPQCFGTQICVQPQGVDEFISNAADLTSTVGSPNIDPVWKWSNDPVAGPWFDMYDVAVFPGWTTVDPGTTQGVAHWVAPHPDSNTITSGLPGEGPTIGPANAEWYARAQFTLPANADPASIRIAATVINADQLAVEFRLNGGAWQPVNASHIDPPFSFSSQVIPGAQAGLNNVFVHVRETVFGTPAAGVKMHLIASYNLGDPQSWTQIVCDDGTVSYFTAAGEQTDALPEDWVIIPCGGGSGATAAVDRVDAESVILCDATPTRFLRTYTYTAAGAVAAFTDTTLTGAAFVPVGAVGTCAAAARDEELLVLCDATPTRFLRRYNYDAATGALLGIVNTTLDGATLFVPVGAVGVCTTAIASDFDFLSTVLCDANGTQFIQRLTFNSATGAVTGTTNTTLTGGAFVPVGAVSLCTSCCPAIIGNGCISTGSGFYTAIRNANGSISLIDSVTGAAVLAANIIPCPSDNTVRTLTAQARLVADADAPWTPGADVVGTLTSVTMTVLTGTATLTDQNGTVLAGLPAGFTATWSAADDNTLSGPTSIDAIGGSTVVHWTQR